MKPRVITDASSLILLSKSQLLREVTEIVDMHTTAKVMGEINVGLEYGKTDAIVTNQLVKEGKIKVKNPKNKLIKKIREDFNLGDGEASIIALYSKKYDTIVTDDNSARKTLRALGIKVLSSLDFPIVLFKLKKVTYEKARISLETLEREGWFGYAVMRRAYRKLEGDKDE